MRERPNLGAVLQVCLAAKAETREAIEAALHDALTEISQLDIAQIGEALTTNLPFPMLKAPSPGRPVYGEVRPKWTSRSQHLSFQVQPGAEVSVLLDSQGIQFTEHSIE